MVRHGMTNRRIATQRGTTLDGVKFHLENIRAKLELSDRASIRRWSGLPRHHALTRSYDMSSPTTEVHFGQIGQIAHTVKDLDATVTFFKDVLGMTHLFTAGQLAFFDCGGTRLMVDAMAEAQGNGNSVLYYLVEDIHASTAALRAKGVAFEGEPHKIFTHPDGTEEWMAFFRDPEKNMLAMMSRVKP